MQFGEVTGPAHGQKGQSRRPHEASCPQTLLPWTEVSEPSGTDERPLGGSENRASLGRSQPGRTRATRWAQGARLGQATGSGYEVGPGSSSGCQLGLRGLCLEHNRCHTSPVLPPPRRLTPRGLGHPPAGIQGAAFPGWSQHCPWVTTLRLKGAGCLWTQVSLCSVWSVGNKPSAGATFRV